VVAVVAVVVAVVVVVMVVAHQGHLLVNYSPNTFVIIRASTLASRQFAIA